MKKFNFKNLHDIFLFGKVLSAGLIMAGYAFLSVWCANWLNGNGFNIFISFSAIPLITGFGIWQTWLVIKQELGSRK